MASETWTEENIETLKRMYAENYSMSEIARKLGCTRNAVSGKIMRLDLYHTRPCAAVVIKKTLRKPRSIPPRPRRAKPQRVLGSLFEVERPDPDAAHLHMRIDLLPVAIVPPRELPPGTGRIVTLEELGPFDCRAMVDPQHYCGQTQGLKWNGSRSSYCPEHHAIYHDRPRAAYRHRRAAVGAGSR